MLCRSARNHFQISDLGETRQDFILYSLDKISVLFVAAEIFERQYRDRSFLGSEWPQALIQPRPTCNGYDRQHQSHVYNDGFSTSPACLNIEPVATAMNSKKQLAR